MKFYQLITLVAFISVAACQAAPPTANAEQKVVKNDNGVPVYQSPLPDNSNSNNNNNNYVPHATYPYADNYPNSAYDGYLVPAGNLQYTQEYMTSLMPAAQNALVIALKIFAKVGLFLVGGVALLVVGGLFTTAVCSLTPLCTLEFHGLQNLNKESVRSYMSPDSLSQAADFVTDAIGKYQRLQRAVTY